MLEFSYEFINDDTINIEYVYGSENFVLNLFNKESVWTLHPFDAILISNNELCRNVISELIKNKYFQIMLAKNNIMLSEVRTTIDLQVNSYERHHNSSDDYRNNRDQQVNGHDNDDFDFNKRGNGHNFEDFVNEVIEFNSLEDIFKKELGFIEEKITLYGKILEKMFMEDYYPGNKEFDQMRELVNMYKDMKKKLTLLIDQS